MDCRLGVIALCLAALTVSGCRHTDRLPNPGLWEDSYAAAPATTPTAGVVDTSQASSTASIEPAGNVPAECSVGQAFLPASEQPDMADKNVYPTAMVQPVQYELPSPATGGDVQFEIIDEGNPAVVGGPPHCDFLATLSPGARRFFDDGTVEYEEPSRWAVIRHRFPDEVRGGWQHLKQDYRNFYSWDGLGMFVVGFGLGAAVANTNADREIQEWYQDDVRSNLSNDFARWGKIFGEGWFVVAVSGTGWAAGEVFYDRPVGSVLGEWGGRSLRSLGVGTPAMLFMQTATGASRPEEGKGSGWHPFEDANGVSGHGFMGALPWINAAKMCEGWPMKAGFYACSFVPAWSRLNSDSHYTSQVLLGWWMAYWAATAVDLTNSGEESNWSVTTTAMGDGTGVGLVYKY
jgi:hypothetical protein